MTVQKMIDILGYRLRDTDNTRFSVALKLDALDVAQHTLTNLIHNAYLTELETKEFAKSCALASGDDEGSFAITGLTNEMLRGGLLAVRYNTKFCHLIEHKNLKSTENAYLTGDANAPIAYMMRNRIYVQCDSNTASVDIWYLKKPSTLQYVYATDSVANGALSGTLAYGIDVVEADLTSATNDYYNGSVLYNKTNDFYAVVYDYVGATTTLKVIYDANEATEWTAADEFYFIKGPGTQEKLGDFECELNEALHEMVVDISEAHCWRMDGKPEKQNAVLEKVYREIEVLNARYVGEAPKGVGSLERGA